jgi:hypothetical protein
MMKKQYDDKICQPLSEEKVSLDDFGMNLEGARELKPIESPDSILGAWFFVHKV